MLNRSDIRSVQRTEREVSGMEGESRDREDVGEVAVPPIEDLFSFDTDQVDFMSAGSFPASDPPPAQSMTAPPERQMEGQGTGSQERGS